ncbi:MAG: hypothetical protein Q9160_001482 [Pyrenula sp. 1 TL-2023]
MGAESQTSTGDDRRPMLRETATPAKDPATTADGDSTGKGSKRRFFGLGKKIPEEKQKPKPAPVFSKAPQIAPMRPVSPLRASDGLRASASPQRGALPYGSPSSPSAMPQSSSPRLHSPASSQIFERNVQEDVVPPQASPQIPSHIVTENHIPPVLEASSEAITDNKLDPDAVEIVTHTAHQPAAVTVTGAGPHEQSMASSMYEDASHSQELEDISSAYGNLDSADVRRLSFISFADVVQGEHMIEAGDPGGRNSLHLAGVPGPQRSPSPIRSPVSSHGLSTSPPTSVSPSFKGVETSPHRGQRGPGSPAPTGSPPPGGDVNIETMRQALRRTGSGDLSGVRSPPMSAVGNDDGTHDKSFK